MHTERTLFMPCAKARLSGSVAVLRSVLYHNDVDKSKR